MTLTAPNCPAADFIIEDVRMKVESIENVKNVDIQLVFRAGMGQRHDERRGKTRNWGFITQSCWKKFTSHPTFIWEQDIQRIPSNTNVASFRWLDSIKQDAGTLYLLGDILDYWYEYRYVVPKDSPRFSANWLELSDNGIDIHWFIGNHDIWIFDYLPHELGITIHDGTLITEIGGKRFFLSRMETMSEKDP